MFFKSEGIGGSSDISTVMPETPARHDTITIVAVSALACILQDVLHEGLGHGVTAWLSGAHRITMSTVALQSDIDTRWISANGTLVNLAAAAVLWLILLRADRYPAVLRYFLVLTMAGNLFGGTGYFLYSGVANFGDWAAVISGLQPHWMWRLILIVVGAGTYYVSMLLVASRLRPFQGREPGWQNLRSVCWIPYFTDGILAGVAGVFNPAGLFYVLVSALPSTLGANAGLMSLPSLMDRRERQDLVRIPRSVPWIVVGALASLLFIFVVGRGITWSR